MEPNHPQISIQRQCFLLGLARSSFYYEPAPARSENLTLLHQLDELYTEFPFFGSRKMTVLLRQQGDQINRKRVLRLMRQLGLQAIYPKPRTSQAHAGHKVYPYLLRGVAVTHVNQVWSSDITYIRMRYGFMYLVAILDWYSRYVLSWELSNSLDADFCVNALHRALRDDHPKIFNTDQGAQFTSTAFTGILLDAKVAISMDGRGRVFDNIFIERLWRSLKYEDIYLKDYQTVPELRFGLARWFEFYNGRRPHQALGYRTPEMVYFGINKERQANKSPQF